MKKITTILSVGLLFITTSLFSQKDCLCYENTYKVPGEIVYSTKGEEKAKEEYYAGILDNKVQFSVLKYDKEGILEEIKVSTYPIADICMTMNDEWSSRSKTEDKTDPKGNYVLLTYGSVLGGKDAGIYIMDRCIKKGDMSPNFLFKSVMRTSTIEGKFTDGKAVLKFYDQVKAIKEGK